MRKGIFTWILLVACSLAGAAENPAYRLFDSKGKKVKYSKMVRDLLQADVVFFGELHNNPIAHWLQLELALEFNRELGDSLVIAAEMFETDDQILVDEYLTGLISKARFEEEAKLWNNYSTDYKPIIEFAKEKGLRLVASNIPRRYASMVASGGFEALEKLSPEALAWIAPLPVLYDPEVGSYKKMMEMGHGGSMANVNFPKAQAIKDATMAHSIARVWEPGMLVFHLNGSFHSENHEGILWYLRSFKPELKMITIATVSQDETDFLEEENYGKADFMVVVPSNMTTTY